MLLFAAGAVVCAGREGSKTKKKKQEMMVLEMRAYVGATPNFPPLLRY
jgi:hypothetical protein